ARERLENFIGLLNERLAKELALSLDERALSHDYIPVIVEFDVTVQPGADRQNQKAVTRFCIVLAEAGECSENNKAVAVSSLYPSLAAFNVQDVQGVSKGFNFLAGLEFLFGGANFAYQRQHDRMAQAMQQAV